MAITLNQIAEICGVSRGTVDRALHNKGNVRPAVAERIKAVANEYGYIPNRAGLALSRASHPIRIGVIMISVQTPFMQLVLDAARREARRLAAFSVEVIFRLSTSLDPVEQVSMIENLVEQHHISALAITPLDCLLVETKINELIDQRGIPVVTFNTDLPNSRRLCYVGQENLSSGRTVAELLRLVTRESGTVATIITPCMYHSAYRERLKGFKEELLTPDSPLQLQEVTLPNDDSNVVYEHTLRLLQETPELTGIYAITPGYAGACSALVDSGRARGVHLDHGTMRSPPTCTSFGAVLRILSSGRMRCSRAHCRCPCWPITFNSSSSRRRSFTIPIFGCCCGTISKICFDPGQEVLCLFRFRHFAVSD